MKLVWVESRDQSSQHPECPVEIMKPKSKRVTFPRAHGKGQSQTQALVLRPGPCPLFQPVSPITNLLLYFKNETISQKEITLDSGLSGSQHFPAPTPKEEVEVGWEKEGHYAVWCSDYICLSFGVSLVSWFPGCSCTNLLLPDLTHRFLIFSMTSYVLLPWVPQAFSVLNHLQFDDTQINICSQIFSPLVSEACESS